MVNDINQKLEEVGSKTRYKCSIVSQIAKKGYNALQSPKALACIIRGELIVYERSFKDQILGITTKDEIAKKNGTIVNYDARPEKD